jgi:hypothetical protein
LLDLLPEFPYTAPPVGATTDAASPGDATTDAASPGDATTDAAAAADRQSLGNILAQKKRQYQSFPRGLVGLKRRNRDMAQLFVQLKAAKFETGPQEQTAWDDEHTAYLQNTKKLFSFVLF